MKKKKTNIFIGLLLIFCILFVDIAPALAEFMDDDDITTRKERQLLKKIEVIHEAFPNQTDEAALYATLVHRGDFTDYVNDSYDPDWDESQFKEKWSGIRADSNSVYNNPLGVVDPTELIRLFLAAGFSAAECLVETVAGIFDTSEENTKTYTNSEGEEVGSFSLECVWTKMVEKFITEPYHNVEERVDAKYEEFQSIDLLTAAAIVMIDSSGWVGTYSDENYQKALAGSGLVGNLADTPVTKFLSSIFNGVFCTVGFMLDVATDGAGVDIATTGFNLSAPITNYAEFGSSAFLSSPSERLSRYYTMSRICESGFIGGTYTSVQDIRDEDIYQGKKDKIAEEIIGLAQQFRALGDNGGGSSSQGAVCYYKVPGIEEEVSDLKVQTIQSEYGNVSGKVGDDIPGEGLIDFETTYIAGVVYPEVGGFDLETKKAQAVAARSYALTRAQAMNGAYNIGITIEGGQWVLRIRTSTSDQVFCHPDLGCGSVNGSMQGTTSGGYTVYAGGVNGNLTRQPLSPDDEIWTAVNETKGQVAVNSSGEVVYTPFASNDQNAWANAVASGSSYKDAIINHYSGDGVVDVTADCRGTLGDYDLEAYYQASQEASVSSGGPAADLANSANFKTIAEFNQHIKDSVNSAGYGTRAGVVAAGISLVGDYIMETGKRHRYSQGNRQDPETEGIGTDNFYMDCSSFAWWALYNGGFKLPCYAQTGEQKSWAQSNGMAETPGSGVGQAGDFLVSDSHIVLILGTYDDGYYVAHFSGTADGAKISKFSYSYVSGYTLINMDSYYNNSSNVR